MVVWELTLVTAYVLGLKRTYRLALRGQRRLLKKRFPRALEFTERRTRQVFNIALSVHREIQRKDISVGKNLGNRLLRMLDRLRPQANIRGSEPPVGQCTSVKPSETKVDNKSNSQPKPDPLVPKDNVAGGNFSTCVSDKSRPGDSAFKSRPTHGLHLKTRAALRPLAAPSACFGSRWQISRWQSGQIDTSSTVNWASRAFCTENQSSIHVLQAGSLQRQHTVFRDDIMRLMDVQRRH